MIKTLNKGALALCHIPNIVVELLIPQNQSQLHAVSISYMISWSERWWHILYTLVTVW